MPARRSDPMAALAAAGQLRLALTPVCQWHDQPEALARGVRPCARDAQLAVCDPVRGRAAVCCAPHGLRLLGFWRQTVPNRPRNAGRVTVAWLPDVSHRLLLAPVVGARRGGARCGSTSRRVGRAAGQGREAA